MTQHTPGPWEHLNGDQIGAIVRERTAIIADCCTESGPQGSQVGPDARQANARLIAAAPDLLAALQSSLQFVFAWLLEYESGPQRERIEAQIAKTQAAIARAGGKIDD